MRFTSLIAAACAIVLAASNVAAVESGVAAQEAYDTGPVHSCKAITQESFAGQIKNACVRRDAGRFHFYYHLNNNKIMRNCNCNDYEKGVRGVNLGTTLPRSQTVQCFTKEGKSAAAVVAIFNRKDIMCSPFEF